MRYHLVPVALHALVQPGLTREGVRVIERFLFSSSSFFLFCRRRLGNGPAADQPVRRLPRLLLRWQLRDRLAFPRTG